jgi:hypothetical protein
LEKSRLIVSRSNSYSADVRQPEVPPRLDVVWIAGWGVLFMCTS